MVNIYEYMIDINAYVISYVGPTLTLYVVRWPFRILCCTTSYGLEAEHRPDYSVLGNIIIT